MEKKEQLNKRQIQYRTTQDAIYSAVNTLVEEMPFESIRIQDICERAGISLGTFYHYFQNKSDILIDRFRRSNQYFNALYNDELIHLHAVDALKRIVLALAEYTRTRLTSILVPYYMAYLQNAWKWQEAEPGALMTVCRNIIERGMETGEIRSKYTAAQIHEHIVTSNCGMVVLQCTTKGAHLDGEDALHVILDWMEGLRGDK